MHPDRSQGELYAVNELHLERVMLDVADIHRKEQAQEQWKVSLKQVTEKRAAPMKLDNALKLESWPGVEAELEKIAADRERESTANSLRLASLPGNAAGTDMVDYGTVSRQSGSRLNVDSDDDDVPSTRKGGRKSLGGGVAAAKKPKKAPSISMGAPSHQSVRAPSLLAGLASVASLGAPSLLGTHGGPTPSVMSFDAQARGDVETAPSNQEDFVRKCLTGASLGRELHGACLLGLVN